MSNNYPFNGYVMMDDGFRSFYDLYINLKIIPFLKRAIDKEKVQKPDPPTTKMLHPKLRLIFYCQMYATSAKRKDMLHTCEGNWHFVSFHQST
jgi:hypothetical protein